MNYVTLNNGVKMPQLGFGVYQIPDSPECEQNVLEAIEAGYRSFDTAAGYLNEGSVGRAIAKSGVLREELFITTKLWIQDASYEAAKKAFQNSLKQLGVEYIDLYLIHQPFGDYYGAWRALEELYKEGSIRAIGVCNFEPDRLLDLILNSEIKPAINQVEIHPFFQQKELKALAKEYDVQLEAWGPFAEGKYGIFTNEVLSKIAKKHGKTVGQVVLRWHMQSGVVTIPKSVHKERMVENFNIWDFELDAEDMADIESLDTGHSEIINFHDIETIKFLVGAKIHD